jgi:hypothetical protein
MAPLGTTDKQLQLPCLPESQDDAAINLMQVTPIYSPKKTSKQQTSMRFQISVDASTSRSLHNKHTKNASSKTSRCSAEFPNALVFKADVEFGRD